MGKDKDSITVDITIEQAVKAIVRSFGDSEDTVIIAMANHMLVTGFQMSYKKYEITIPEQESVHVECYILGGAVSGYLFDVVEKGWGSVTVDPKFCELITRTKDENGKIIVRKQTKGVRDIITGVVATYDQSEIRDIKRVVERYTGEPIPFRKFKARIALFEELREKNNMSIPEHWVDDSSEGAQDRIDGTDWGTDWGDIAITIETSGNLFLKRISAAVGQREHASKLGLVGVQNNDPTAEGKVMMRLASGLSVKTNTANKKYISKIRTSLKLFFKIEHDPFHEYDNSYGYKPKFTLKETITSQGDRARRRATPTTYDDGVQTEKGFEELTDVERAVEDMSQAEKDAEIEQLAQSQTDPFGDKGG